MRLLIGLLLALTTTTAHAEGRTPLRLTTADRGTARAAFTELLVQSNQGGDRLIGMPGPAEQSRTDLGIALPVAMLGLEPLRGYKPGAPLDGFVHHLDVVLYTVQVDQDVRAEIEFTRRGTGWQAVRVGAPAHAREIARLARVLGPPAYLLRVPGLGLELLAYGTGDAQRFALVHGAPGVDLKAGQPLPAHEVLRVLAPLARAHDGKLR